MAANEAAVVHYGQEFFRTHRVSQATFDAALAQFGVRGLAELTNLMGFYATLAFNANAFGMDLPEERTETVLPIQGHLGSAVGWMAQTAVSCAGYSGSDPRHRDNLDSQVRLYLKAKSVIRTRLGIAYLGYFQRGHHLVPYRLYNHADVGIAQPV